MTKLPIDSTYLGRSSANGASDSSKMALKAWRSNTGAVGWADFSPGVVAEIKVLACELPYENGFPLSRFSMAELK
jgi:hypothetical protein